MGIRLINLVADDNAIEDTIYHLHRALNTGRIDLERFLRVSGVPLPHDKMTHLNRNLVDPCASRRAVHETCLG